MGCYVNPHDTTKEAWLLEHGREVGRIDIAGGRIEAPTWESFGEGHLPVVLVHSHPQFNAAGVAYCAKEYQCFIDVKRDVRYREIYSVPLSDLRGVSPIDEYLRRA